MMATRRLNWVEGLHSAECALQQGVEREELAALRVLTDSVGESATRRVLEDFLPLADTAGAGGAHAHAAEELECAALAQRWELVRRLLRMRPDLSDVQLPGTGMTLLHLAAARGSAGTVELLVRVYGASMHRPSRDDGESAFDMLKRRLATVVPADPRARERDEPEAQRLLRVLQILTVANQRGASGYPTLPPVAVAPGVAVAAPSSRVRPRCRRVLPGAHAPTFVIDELLSADEASALARETAAQVASIGWEYDPAYRSGERFVFLAPWLAHGLWARLAPLLDEAALAAVRPFGFGNGGSWRPQSVNPCMRVTHYSLGDKFSTHMDGAFVQEDDLRSAMTLLVYLSDNPASDATVLYAQRPEPRRSGSGDSPATRCEVVVPKRGRAALFVHDLWHEGRPVQYRPGKTVLRTDVMFRRVQRPATLPLFGPVHAESPLFEEAERLYQQSITLQREGKPQASTQAYLAALQLQAQLPSAVAAQNPRVAHVWLPAAAAATMLGYLDVADVGRCACVSRAMQVVADSGAVWLPKFHAMWPADVAAQIRLYNAALHAGAAAHGTTATTASAAAAAGASAALAATADPAGGAASDAALSPSVADASVCAMLPAALRAAYVRMCGSQPEREGDTQSSLQLARLLGLALTTPWKLRYHARLAASAGVPRVLCVDIGANSVKVALVGEPMPFASSMAPAARYLYQLPVNLPEAERGLVRPCAATARWAAQVLGRDATVTVDVSGAAATAARPHVDVDHRGARSLWHGLYNAAERLGVNLREEPPMQAVRGAPAEVLPWGPVALPTLASAVKGHYWAMGSGWHQFDVGYRAVLGQDARDEIYHLSLGRPWCHRTNYALECATVGAIGKYGVELAAGDCEAPVLLAVPAWMPLQRRAALVAALRSHGAAAAVTLVDAPVAALTAHGAHTGVVLQAGAELLIVAPVLRGMVLRQHVLVAHHAAALRPYRAAPQLGPTQRVDEGDPRFVGDYPDPATAGYPMEPVLDTHPRLTEEQVGARYFDAAFEPTVHVAAYASVAASAGESVAARTADGDDWRATDADAPMWTRAYPPRPPPRPPRAASSQVEGVHVTRALAHVLDRLAADADLADDDRQALWAGVVLEGGACAYFKDRLRAELASLPDWSGVALHEPAGGPAGLSLSVVHGLQLLAGAPGAMHVVLGRQAPSPRPHALSQMSAWARYACMAASSRREPSASAYTPIYKRDVAALVERGPPGPADLPGWVKR